MLDVDLGLLVCARADVLRQQGSAGAAQVSLAVRCVLEQLAIPAEVALRRRDVAVGLDAVGPERVGGILDGEPPVRRRARDDDVVALGDIEGTEDRLEASRAALDVDTLVADGIAVPGAGSGRDGVGDPHVTVAEDEPAARDHVGRLHGRVVEEVVQLEVAGRQGLVRGRRLVPTAPRPATQRRSTGCCGDRAGTSPRRTPPRP